MKEKVETAVRNELGREPNEIKRLEDGLKQETFAVKVSGEEYVVQFLADDYEEHNSLSHCLSCYQWLQDSSIPVPEVVTKEVSHLGDDPYSIVEKVPGSSMEQDISPEKVRKSGKILAKIHDFRSFDQEGWIKFQDGEMETVEFEEGNQKKKNLKELNDNIQVFREDGFTELADKVENLFEETKEIIPEQAEPVFCHDDFSPDNIIWKDGEIKAVIDFDTAYSGDRIRNIVHSANAFWMHNPGADWNIRETFYQGYKKERKLGEDFDKLEPLYRSQTLIGLIAGMIKMDELSKYEKEFYEEEIMKELAT